MAKKMSTGQKLLIAGAVIVGGIVVYKMVLAPHTTTTTQAPTPSGSLPSSGTAGGGVLNDVKSIFDSISKIFAKSSPSTATNGTTLPNPSDYGMTVGGNRRGIVYR